MIYTMPSMTKLVELHNEARKGGWFVKRPKLEIDESLMRYAYEWADTMAENEALVHSDMKKIMQLGFRQAAENIAQGQRDEKTVMSTWLNSRGHRSNIMNSNYNKIGCGFSYSDNGKIYWCVCFGKS